MRRRAAVPAASVLHIRANDQKNDQQHDGDDRVRADGGGKQPAEEEGKIAVAGIITVTVIVAAAVISSAVISASAVAVVVEVAHVRVRAHRADGRKDERAQHQRCEENTNRFFHHSDRCLPQARERLPFLRNAGESPGSCYINLRAAANATHRGARPDAAVCVAHSAYLAHSRRRLLCKTFRVSGNSTVIDRPLRVYCSASLRAHGKILERKGFL